YRKNIIMSESLLLILFSLAMFLGSYLSGLVPLAFSLSESKMRYVTVLGAGLLVGTALAVIMPEGVHALYINELETNHLHSHHLKEQHSHEAGVDHIDNPQHALNEKKDQQLSSSKELQQSKELLANQHKADNEGDLEAPALKHNDTTHSAIGAASSTSHFNVEIIVFMAIMLHKAPAAFGLVSFLMADGVDRKRIRRHLLIFSLAAPLMALFTYVVLKSHIHETYSGDATGLAMLFSAGTFLFVATVHVLPEVQAHYEDRQFRAMADIYVVERILDKRIIDDQIHYYLKWFGFGDDECTWEPEENVFCTDLVKDFERKQQEKQHEKELLQERKNGENVFDECAQTITSILNETESATSAKILNHIIEEKVEKSLLSIREDEQLSSKTTNNQSNDTTATSISDFESLLLAIKIDENRSQQQLMPATIINNVDEENNRTSSDDTYYSFDGGKNIEIEEDNADNDVKQISNISDDDLGMSSDSQKTIEYQVNQRSDDENLMKENDTDEENRESSVSNNYSKEQNAQIKPKINNLNGTPSADIIDETNQVLSMNDDEIVSDDHQLLEDLRSSNQHHLEARYTDSLSFLEKRCTRKHHLANDENWRQLKRRRLQDEIQASPSSKSSSNSLVDENGNHLVKDNKLDAGHSYGKKLEMSEKQKLSETTGAAQSTSKPATFDFLGLEPEEIVCITRSKSTELQFLLKCAKCPNKLFYITNRQATEIIPQLV
ncbi:unnamed protein product, partial [Didymodactylos carnosus]